MKIHDNLVVMMMGLIDIFITMIMLHASLKHDIQLDYHTLGNREKNKKKHPDIPSTPKDLEIKY